MTDTATAQQKDVFGEVTTGDTSILVEARAGTGKTWTLVECMKGIAAMGRTMPVMPRVALTAYNNKIARELEAKISKAGLTNSTVGTFHSFGYKAWRALAPNAKLDEKAKWAAIIEEVEIPLIFQSFVKKAVSLAKQRAIGVLTALNDPQAWLALAEHFDLQDLLESEDELDANIHFQTSLRDRKTPEEDSEELLRDALRWSCKALASSIKMSKQLIDFDDMIYMPLKANARMTQYDWIMVDEAQDTNPARRELAKRMLKDGGRAIFVGDPFQAIYGFTGADNDSLDIICREFNAKRLPLTMTFRCAKSVVRVAQSLVPDYQAFEANPEGEYRVVQQEDFDSTAAGAFEFTPGEDAILCRNTKPLIDIAFSLIRRGIPCHVEGKNIGKDLVKLVTRWKSVKTCRALADRLGVYREDEVNKLLAKGKEMQADAVQDRVDTILAIIEGVGIHSTVEQLKNKIESMFADTPEGEKAKTVSLMTAHRSKGLEFKRVFLYGRNKFMPSRFAKQEWQFLQEKNLEYVAITRAEQTLIEVMVH